MPAAESSTSVRESLRNDSGEFADFLPDTHTSFEAWLDSLRPTPRESFAPASPFQFEGTLRIDGAAAGVVNSQTGMFVVSETAEFSGNVFVATAIIDGLVRGDIRASERVEVGSTARVFGNIETPALAVQPGAVFEGQCRSLPPPIKAPAESAAISRASSSQGSRSTAKPEPSESLAVAAAH